MSSAAGVFPRSVFLCCDFLSPTKEKTNGICYWQCKLEKVFQILKQGRKFLYMCVYVRVYLCVCVFKGQCFLLCEDLKSEDFAV